jgi:hypothetical protein
MIAAPPYEDVTALRVAAAELRKAGASAAPRFRQAAEALDFLADAAEGDRAALADLLMRYPLEDEGDFLAYAAALADAAADRARAVGQRRAATLAANESLVHRRALAALDRMEEIRRWAGTLAEVTPPEGSEATGRELPAHTERRHQPGEAQGGR